MIYLENYTGVLEVYNIAGDLIKKTNASILSLHEFNNGLYILKARDKTGRVFSNKLVKQ